MASISRLARTIQSCRTMAASRTLASPSRHLANRSYNTYSVAVQFAIAGTFKNISHPNTSSHDHSQESTEAPGLYSIAIMAGLFGAHLIDDAPEFCINLLSTHVSLAKKRREQLFYCEDMPSFYSVIDAEINAEAKSPTPPESPSTYVDVETTAKKERVRLEELLKSKAMQYGSYPRFTVAMKVQKVQLLP